MICRNIVAERYSRKKSGMVGAEMLQRRTNKEGEDVGRAKIIQVQICEEHKDQK